MINKKILFILLFSLTFCFAADDDISYCNVNLDNDSIGLMLIGLLISLLFVSLFFMYGKFIGGPEIEGTYMVELQQIGLTLVLILFISGGVELLCNVGFAKEGVYLGSENNVYNSVRTNQLKLMEKTMDFYVSLMDTLNGYGRMSSLTAGFKAGKGGFIGIVFNPMSYATFLTQMMAPVGQSVLIAYFAQAFQYALFEFTRSKLFLMLLPIGLVLRSFPITRKFGGVLVALVIGLSYLYPLFLNLGYVFIDFDSMGTISGPYAYNSAETFGMFVAYAGHMMGLTQLGTRFPGPALTVLEVLFATMFEGFSSGLIFKDGGVPAIMGILGVVVPNSVALSGLLGLLYKQFASIAVATFFIPALMIIILGGVVRSLSASIGTETDITGILRAV